MGGLFGSMKEMEFDVFPYLATSYVETKSVNAASEIEPAAATFVERAMQTKGTTLVDAATQTQEIRTNPYSIYRIT